MSVRANYDPKFFRRFLFIALGCLAFTGWCFYDALIGYPSEFERSRVYWQPSEASKDYEGMERAKWREIVAEKGWPTDQPKKPDEIKKSISNQYLYALICIVIALPCLIKWLRARGSWVNGDATELTTSKGQTIPYPSIVKIDKTKWEKKGITRIHYNQDGTAKTYTFDDFKFDRQKMGEILEQIEQGLQDEQIEGGDRQSVIKARIEQQKQEKAAKEAELTAQLKTETETTEDSDTAT